MRLVHPILSKPIHFEENYIHVLIVENGSLLTQLITDILMQQNNEEGKFVLSKEFKPIPIPKHLEIITDLFTLNLNSRPIANKLYEALQIIAHNEDCYMQSQHFKQELTNYLEHVLVNTKYNINYDNDFDLIQIFKACKIEIDAHSMLERITEYCDILTNLLKISCIIFVNAKSFLTIEEINLLYDEILYKKYNVLFIESHDSEVHHPNEKRIIIDKDLCELMFDNGD